MHEVQRAVFLPRQSIDIHADVLTAPRVQTTALWRRPISFSEPARSHFLRPSSGAASEEADESVDWLEYLRDGRIKHDPALLQEATELAKILATAYRTSRRNNEGNASRT